MKRYFGAPVIRQGLQPARHHAPHHGYWNHAYRANNAMPAYGGFFGAYGGEDRCKAYEMDIGTPFGPEGGLISFTESIAFDEHAQECVLCYQIVDSEDNYITDECDVIDMSYAIESEEIAQEEATSTAEQAVATHATESAAIAAVKGAKVKNKADFNKLVGNVKAAYKFEKGKDLSWSKSTPSDALGIAPLFGDLTSAASGASKTQAAITSAAGWFYCNTEKEALKNAGKDKEYKEAEEYCKSGGSSGSSGGGRSSSPSAGSSLGKTKAAQRFYRQTWFYWTAGIVGALVIFGVPTGIMVSKKRKKKSA